MSYGLYCEQILAKCSKVFFLAVRNNSYWLHFSLRPSSDAVARKNYLALTGFPLFRQACFTASSRSVPIGQLHHASSYVTACSGFQLGLRMRRGGRWYSDGKLTEAFCWVRLVSEAANRKHSPGQRWLSASRLPPLAPMFMESRRRRRK